MGVVKPSIFNEKASKVGEFITAYKLYIRMRMRKESVEEQMQYILTYVQEELADIQKKNILEDLKVKEIEFVITREFLAELKKEFEEGDNKSAKVAKLKKVEQGPRTMKEFVQEIRKVARDNKYKEKALVEKFKQEMNRVIRKNLIEAERPSQSIDQ